MIWAFEHFPSLAQPRVGMIHPGYLRYPKIRKLDRAFCDVGITNSKVLVKICIEGDKHGQYIVREAYKKGNTVVEGVTLQCKGYKGYKNHLLQLEKSRERCI